MQVKQVKWKWKEQRERGKNWENVTKRGEVALSEEHAQMRYPCGNSDLVFTSNYRRIYSDG